jgi:hypothetical protein
VPLGYTVLLLAKYATARRMIITTMMIAQYRLRIPRKAMIGTSGMR